jgi:hypothetical protein
MRYVGVKTWIRFTLQVEDAASSKVRTRWRGRHARFSLTHSVRGIAFERVRTLVLALSDLLEDSRSYSGISHSLCLASVGGVSPTSRARIRTKEFADGHGSRRLSGVSPHNELEGGSRASLTIRGQVRDWWMAISILGPSPSSPRVATIRTRGSATSSKASS